MLRLLKKEANDIIIILGDSVDLREFLFRERKSITQLSKELMVSRNYLSQISLGNLQPSLRLARDIERVTDGKVTVKELMKGKIS